MPATKSGTYINITGTGNTLATMHSDINDNTWIERTTEIDGSYTYNVKTAVVNYINLATDAVLTIGNPNDYSFKEKLKFIFSSNNSGYFNTLVGSHFKVYGNVEIDFGSLSQSQYVSVQIFYGNIEIYGNVTYKPYLYNSRQLRLYAIDTDLTRISQSYIRINNAQFGNCFYDTPIFGIFPMTHIWNEFEFKNVQFKMTTTAITYNYLYNTNDYSIPTDKLIFENISIDANSKQYALLSPAGNNVYLKNTVWDSTFNNYSFQVGWSNNWELHNNNLSLNEDLRKKLKYSAQRFDMVLDNVTFNTGVHPYYSFVYRSRLLLKNCVAQDLKKILCGYGGIISLWNSDSLYSNVFAAYYGRYCKVFKLDLTIKDEQGNPIEDCNISINDKNEKEEYNCRTNFLGKIYSMYNIDGILLSNRIKEPAPNTAESIISDTSNNTYHIVSIYKPGFKPQTFNVVMDQDRAIEIIMKPIGQIQKLRGTVRQFKLQGKVKQFKLKGIIKRNG